MISTFKAQLAEIPRIKKEKSEEFVELGKFTVNKKYKVYSVYAEETFTDFLVADSNNQFFWLNMSIFRK